MNKKRETLVAMALILTNITIFAARESSDFLSFLMGVSIALFILSLITLWMSD